MEGLIISEYKDSMKMIGDVAPVRSNPGRSKDGTQCRRCSSAENYVYESLPHILGFCPFEENLRKKLEIIKLSPS
jgi:hypothetical protein